jgi:hypothetical protein
LNSQQAFESDLECFSFCASDCRRKGESRASGRELKATSKLPNKTVWNAGERARRQRGPFPLLTRGDTQTIRKPEGRGFVGPSASQADGTSLDNEDLVREQRIHRE